MILGDARQIKYWFTKTYQCSNGTRSTDGVNLGQVETLVAGQSLFKGAYDATNEPGSPAIFWSIKHR